MSDTPAGHNLAAAADTPAAVDTPAADIQAVDIQVQVQPVDIRGRVQVQAAGIPAEAARTLAGAVAADTPVAAADKPVAGVGVLPSAFHKLRKTCLQRMLRILDRMP